MQMITEFINILNAMSPYLLLGFLVAGLLHAYMPKQVYSRYLSKKGFKSVFLSALFGVPLPLCSCGVIPTAMSLKKEGATDGATVSFLIATPQTGVDSILATYGVLGLPFAIIRPVIALIVGVVGGLFTDKFSKSKEVVVEESATKCSCSSHTQSHSKIVTALKYGFVDMLQDLGLWLAIGLVVAAAITAFVPHSVFATLNENYLLNIVVVLLLSIPMYICSTGSIPIALSLLMNGVSPGAALVFLMAGPATNVATLTVVKKVLGTRTTLLYLLSIIIGALGFALLIDFCLPPEWFVSELIAANATAHCEGGAAWWEIASSALFVVLLIGAYISKYRHGASHSHSHSHDEHEHCHHSHDEHEHHADTHEEKKTQTFKVTGMRCNHCKANVEKAIMNLEGVVAVSIELTSGTVEVEGTVSAEDVSNAVHQLGFNIEI